MIAGFRMSSPCLLLALAALVGHPTMAEAQYAPPIGIPAPSFGINESHQMYAGQTYAAGGFAYRDAGNGPYSHYVDNSVSCTDTNNTYGTAASPRCSIPTTVAAGSVVEIHGGPYTPGILWTANGTSALPVFWRGTSKTTWPTITGLNDLEVTGTFAIVEFLNGDAIRFTLSGSDTTLRRCDVGPYPGGGVGQLVRLAGSRHVVYDCEIHDNSGTDRHGVFAGPVARDLWIVDNHIHNNSGDSIQFCHSCVGGVLDGPANVYIGRNRMHDDIENCIDLKEFIGPVIISENECYNYASSAQSNGDAIRINDEGAQGEVWIIANRIHDSVIGINPDDSNSSVNQGVYVIGNILWNISGSGVGRDATFVLNNTIYNVNTGIALANEARNNIIMNASSTAIGTVVTCSHNLVFGGGAVAGACTNRISANPLFVNTSIFDFRQQAGSPARNAGTVASSYQTFLTKYGRSIALDPDRRPRPLEGIWDVGAYEFGAGGSAPAPTAPTSLTVR